MWGNPTYRGNVIRYNYWHHIGDWRHGGEQPACGQAGIRLDDAISGVRVHGNVFYRAAGGRQGFGGVQIHGGKDNVVSNNLFVDCRAAISFSAWGDQRWRAFTASALQSPDIDPALYLARYPDLARLSEDHDANLIAGNLVYDCSEFFRRDPGRNTLADNVVTKKNPGFAGAACGSFSHGQHLPPNFQPIPFDEIGLYVDQFRKQVATQSVSQARAER